jgi:hypothetical protein
LFDWKKVEIVMNLERLCYLAGVPILEDNQNIHQAYNKQLAFLVAQDQKERPGVLFSLIQLKPLWQA